MEYNVENVVKVLKEIMRDCRSMYLLYHKVNENSKEATLAFAQYQQTQLAIYLLTDKEFFNSVVAKLEMEKADEK